MTGLRDSDDYAEAAAVVAFWQELGLPGLVDVHTHFMPSNAQAKVWAALEALARLDLGSAWLRAVCHDNAARLPGLS